MIKSYLHPFSLENIGENERIKMEIIQMNSSIDSLIISLYINWKSLDCSLNSSQTCVVFEKRVINGVCLRLEVFYELIIKIQCGVSRKITK